MAVALEPSDGTSALLRGSKAFSGQGLEQPVFGCLLRRRGGLIFPIRKAIVYQKSGDWKKEGKMDIVNFLQIRSLDDYIEVQRKHYDACIDSIQHDLKIEGFDATLRFKYLKFDGNRQPKVKILAEIIANYLVYYSCSMRTWDRTPFNSYDHSQLERECREFLREYAQSGEAGEILLYFLLETVLRAPQMVAKLELKTNPKFETLGSDGIHMRWNPNENLIDVYFGEAKLYQTIYSALDELFVSLNNFHENDMVKHELKLVTRHYKWADSRLKDAVLNFINPQEPNGDFRINHACLVGYDWNKYIEILAQPQTAINDFINVYSQDTTRLKNLLQSRFNNGFQYNKFKYEVFFLPFVSVDEFRESFLKAVGIT